MKAWNRISSDYSSGIIHLIPLFVVGFLALSVVGTTIVASNPDLKQLINSKARMIEDVVPEKISQDRESLKERREAAKEYVERLEASKDTVPVDDTTQKQVTTEAPPPTKNLSTTNNFVVEGQGGICVDVDCTMKSVDKVVSPKTITSTTTNNINNDKTVIKPQIRPDIPTTDILPEQPDVWPDSQDNNFNYDDNADEVDLKLQTVAVMQQAEYQRQLSNFNSLSTAPLRVGLTTGLNGDSQGATEILQSEYTFDPHTDSMPGGLPSLSREYLGTREDQYTVVDNLTGEIMDTYVKIYEVEADGTLVYKPLDSWAENVWNDLLGL